MARRALKLLLVLAFVSPATILFGQQVGDNVNVLPVYKTVVFDPATGGYKWQDDGYDYLRGNLFGQRLNEPAILVSSRNKDHIVVFFNDYRAVDVQADQPIPGTTTTPLSAMWRGVRGFFARLAGRPAKGKEQPGDPDHAAFSQAAVGCSVTYDGGLTWTGCFVPGMPFDTRPASVVSPSYARALQGMSDPAVAQGKCGKGYLANIAFTYNQGSEMQVHTLQDQNDSDKQHTWDWKYIAPVADCNNASWGCFVDKPAIATFVLPQASCTDVTETVYTTFTTFTGTSGTGSTKFQSKVNLATSTDGGRSFATQLVDGNYTQVQGTDVEVSPAATATDPAGTIFVFFRSFSTPNSIILRRSTARSSGWDKPVDILAVGDPSHPTLQTFDQPTIGLATTATNPQDALTFRSNAFPAAAITPDGKVLIVTFQEKADANGVPSPTGTPRIMMTYSTNGGRTWSPRKAISYGTNRKETVGLGFFRPATTNPGPQVQPAIACSSNSSCLVTWMESKDPGLGTTGWISGYSKKMNQRAMALQVTATGVVTAGPGGSVQVSRYSYRDDTKRTADAEDDVEQVTAGGGTFAMWNYFNFNNYDTGKSPFDGDYTDIRPLTSNTFITAFTDNRYVVPATNGSGGASAPWLNFANYGVYPGCMNPGSRAQTVMAAQISNGLVVTAPTNYKPFAGAPTACAATLDPVSGVWSQPTKACVEFPFSVWNNTDNDKRYLMWLSGAAPALPSSAGQPNASFAKDVGTGVDYTFPLLLGGLNIFQRSSNSANVYVLDGNPVTVNIAECRDGQGNSVACTGFVPTAIDASVTFNSPASAPPAGSPGTFSYAPSSVTVSGRNVSGRNVSGRNVSGRNVSGRNVSGRNTVPSDSPVVEYSVNVTPTSTNDAGTYLSLFNIDEAYLNDYVFQVLVTKPLTSFTTVGPQCEPYNSLDGALVGQVTNVSGRNVSGRNVSGRNVSGRNPVPIDGDFGAQVLQNTSFTMGSSTKNYLDTSTVAGSGSQTSFGCPGGWGRIGECTQAAPRLPNIVTVTLRAIQITSNPARVFDPEVAPPAVTIAEYACKTDSCLAASGPDLAVPAPPAAGVSPTDVPAGAQVTFPVSSVTVTNIGKDCTNGDPCGTAQPHKWAIYLSTAVNAVDLPRYQAGDACPAGTAPSLCAPGMIKQNLTDLTKPVTALLLENDFTQAVPANGTEVVAPQTVVIPATMPRLNADGTGTYYAYLYIDDQRVVSELNEDNNIVKGGPITVRASSYDVTTLLTPCGPGLKCDRSGGGAVPIAWQFSLGGAAVDTQALRPTLVFYKSDTTWLQGSQLGSALSPCSGGGTCDLSTGSSGFQYCDASGTFTLCAARPPFTWQYNWERKDPTTGQSLLGNFILWINPTPTQNCQNGAACAPGTKAVGPIRITLR